MNELRVSYHNNKNIYLLSGDDSGCIYCWDLSDIDHIKIFNLLDIKMQLIICVLSDKQQNLLCTASRDEYLRSYSIPSGKILFSIKDNEGSVRGIDANQKYIISGGKDEMIRCYDIQQNYKLIWALQRHQDYLNKIIIDNHNQLVFTADRNGLVIS